MRENEVFGNKKYRSAEADAIFFICCKIGRFPCQDNPSRCVAKREGRQCDSGRGLHA